VKTGISFWVLIEFELEIEIEIEIEKKLKDWLFFIDVRAFSILNSQFSI